MLSNVSDWHLRCIQKPRVSELTSSTRWAPSASLSANLRTAKNRLIQSTWSGRLLTKNRWTFCSTSSSSWTGTFRKRSSPNKNLNSSWPKLERALRTTWDFRVILSHFWSSQSLSEPLDGYRRRIESNSGRRTSCLFRASKCGQVRHFVHKYCIRVSSNLKFEMKSRNGKLNQNCVNIDEKDKFSGDIFSNCTIFRWNRISHFQQVGRDRLGLAC